MVFNHNILFLTMSKIDPEYQHRLSEIKLDIELVRARIDELFDDIRKEMSIATIGRVVARERAEKAVGNSEISEDEEAVFAGALRKWEPHTEYEEGDIRSFDDAIWICQQPHTSQEDWTPDVAVSLWSRYRQEGIVTQWVQPDGAGGPNLPYNTGDRVEHNGSIWVSLVDDNVWEPGTDANLWEQE